jgi:hypothetical protein
MCLDQILTIVFSGISAISTLVYACFAIPLWIATRRSAKLAQESIDITKFTYFINLAKEIEIEKQKNIKTDPSLTNFYDELNAIILNFGLKSFFKNIKPKKNKDFLNYFKLILDLCKKYNFDPDSLSFLTNLFPSFANKEK